MTQLHISRTGEIFYRSTRASSVEVGVSGFTNSIENPWLDAVFEAPL